MELHMEKPVDAAVTASEIPEANISLNAKTASNKRIGKPRPKKRAEQASRKRPSRNFPASSFEEALEFAKAIFKFGSGNPIRRLTLFNELGKSPESGASRQ